MLTFREFGGYEILPSKNVGGEGVFKRLCSLALHNLGLNEAYSDNTLNVFTKILIAIFPLYFFLVFGGSTSKQHTVVKSRHWYFMRFCYLQLVPGPPFVFGALLVICALLVAVFIPENVGVGTSLRSSSKRHPGLWIYSLMVSLFSSKWIISSNV